MTKLCMKLYKMILIILVFSTIYCSVITIFGAKTTYAYEPLILFIGIYFYICIVCFVYQQCQKCSDKHIACLIVFMLSIYLFLTLVFGLRIKSERPVDIFNLHNAAISYLRTGQIANVDYFSTYPYQLNFAYLLILIYKFADLAGIVDYRTVGTLFGALLLFFSAILTYKIAEKVKDKYMGIAALFVFITNPIFWIYSSYYYTDLTGMLFLLLTIYIALCINSRTVENTSIWLCILLGALVTIGYKFRATVAIGGIAVLGLGIIKFIPNCKAERIKLIKYFVAFLIGCILALICWNLIDSYFAVELDKDKKFPIVHWIMMGLTEESSGKWSSKCWNYTNSFPTYEEKLSGNISAIKSSLSEMGILRLLKLLLNKLVTTWSDGMTALIVNFKTSVHYGPLYEYTIGNKSVITCYATQIMRGSLLISVIPFIFYELKNIFNKKSILTITFFGYMLFYCFWEVHEKYVFMFLPLLIVMAVYGIHLLTEMLRNFKEIAITGKNEYKITKDKIYKYITKVCTVFIIATLFIWIFSWESMVVEPEKKYNFVVYQSSTTDQINVADSTVKQTFLTNTGFNGILIKFLNNDVPSDQEYTFSLFNDSNTLLYKEIFQANDIKNNVYHAFCFDEVKVTEYHEFSFEVEANNHYSNTLTICSAGNSYSDYYSRGICSVSDEEKGDLTFRVYNIETVGYYPKLFYVIILIAVLLIEGSVYFSICKKHGS